jgi:hypothetical protein
MTTDPCCPNTYFATFPNGQRMDVVIDKLSYTAWGWWLVIPSSVTNPPGPNATEFYGAWLAGYQTPGGSIPSSGSATYRGNVEGFVGGVADGPQYLTGGITITADFADRSVTGQATGLQIRGDDLPSATNDIAFSATFNPATDLFTGTTSVTSADGLFSGAASGVVSGRFFGPAANEVGGVFTLSDTGHQLIASFGASR